MKKYISEIGMILMLMTKVILGEGTTGAQFLSIGIGARACAMGQAYGAIADDPSGIYWNPAGLSAVTSSQVMFCQNFWLLDMTHQYLAGVLPYHGGAFGLSAYYSSSGDIPKIEDFIKIGEYSAYDAAVSLAFARSLNSQIGYGLSAKYIAQKIDTENGSTFAFDIGLIYDFRRDNSLKIALAIQNIGPGVKFIDEKDKLPLNIKLSSAYLKENYALGIGLDREIDSDVIFGLGGEYVIKKTLALRAGYNTAHSYSLGFGICWQKFDLSYCFAPNKDLDASHRLSLVYGR